MVSLGLHLLTSSLQMIEEIGGIVVLDTSAHDGQLQSDEGPLLVLVLL